MSDDFARPEFLVSTDWLGGHLEDTDLRVFDCSVHLAPLPDNSGQVAASARGDYEAGHIPGSAFIDLQDDLSDASSPLRFVVPDADAFAAAMSRLGVGPGLRVVLYDRSRNQWAARVWWMLRGFGFDNVAVLDGGWPKWTAEGRPVSTEAVRYAEAQFEANPRPDMFADKDAVRAGIDDPQTHLLNALTREQHAGHGGVNYGRAGRIPGSAVVPARDLIEPATQAYKPAAELRRLFAEAGVLDGKRVIVYCGGGIAASSDALVLSALGVKDVAVYTNSLQEWAPDGACPMETD